MDEDPKLRRKEKRREEMRTGNTDK